MNRFFSQLKKPLLPCGGFSLKPKTMICNGINFSEQWLSKFYTAEDFANHPKHQYFIDKKMVSKEALVSFFELYLSQQTIADVNIHQNVSGEVSETQPQSSDSGNSESQTGSDSQPAGDTIKQGANKKRR
jgi:hypothetical protein